MLNSKAILIAATMMVSSSAMAIDVDCTAGNLAQLITDNSDATTLTVTGQVNAADLATIAQMASLKTLDLSQAKIEAYSGDILPSGSYNAEANTIPAYIFLGLTAEQVTLPGDITAIGESAFAGSAIKALTIPATVTSIGRYAFADCASLTTITVPATVTTVGDGLFSGCSALTEAIFQANVDAIEASTFAGCSALKSLEANTAIASIGDNAFAGCTALTQIPNAARLSKIGTKAFYGSGILQADLKQAKGVAIGDFAFAECKSLASVNLPDDATIGQGLFFDDSALQSIALPAAIDRIPSFTFKGTNNLAPEQVLTNNIKSIGDYALTGWDTITTATLPSSLESIGDYAMADWAAIATIFASDNKTVPTLGENVWENVDQASAILYVKEEVFDQFSSADQWKEFNVQISTTAVSDINADGSAISFYRDGSTLVIESQGSDIVNTVVYDLQGRRCYSKADQAQSVRIATDAWTPGVIIVAVTLDNGAHTAFKIALN